MRISQITKNQQVNYPIYKEKDNALNNKIKALLSQLPGKLRSVNFKYNNNHSITKAEVTVVVSSKEEAIKVQQNASDGIDINIIIIDDLKNNKANINNKTQKNDLNKGNKIIKEENNFFEDNTYTYNRGPDGKIYGLIRTEKNEINLRNANTRKNDSINDRLKRQYINIYKRYGFKNIKIKENPQDNNFSIDV